MECTCSGSFSIGMRLLALATVLRFLAAVFYLLRTRGIGTPFSDSLTEEQRAVRGESERVRGRIYASSLLYATLAVISLLVVRERSNMVSIRTA